MTLDTASMASAGSHVQSGMKELDSHSSSVISDSASVWYEQECESPAHPGFVLLRCHAQELQPLMIAHHAAEARSI